VPKIGSNGLIGWIEEDQETGGRIRKPKLFACCLAEDVQFNLLGGRVHKLIRTGMVSRTTSGISGGV